MNGEAAVKAIPISADVERLNNEAALWAAVDSGVFAALQSLQLLPGGRAVQAVYTVILRRYPNIKQGKEGMALDAGWSQPTVKRAIGLLKKAGLIQSRQRGRGLTAVIELPDLRDRETVKACLAKIRAMAKTVKPRSITSDPASSITSDPASSITSDPPAVSQVTHKASREQQEQKQQDAAAGSAPADETLAAADKAPLKKALADADIGEPMLGQLVAKLPAEAADIVPDLAAQAKQRASRNWKGLLVRLLESDGLALLAQAKAIKDKQQRDQQAVDEACKRGEAQAADELAQLRAKPNRVAG